MKRERELERIKTTKAAAGSLAPIPGTDGQDYRLKARRSCWIVSGRVSVWIRTAPGGRVLVELHRAGKEAQGGPLDTAAAK